MVNYIKSFIKKRRKMQRWYDTNRHNSTYPINNFNFEHVKIGKYTYGGLCVLDFSNNMRLSIGNFCSIASGVVFALAADHNINTISTFPFYAKCLSTNLNEAVSKGDITVDDDVWIGQNAIILSGVHIGQGAVIAAGAVVNKDVPPYSVVGGVPAKFIKKRFEDYLIKELLTIDYSQLSEEMILKNKDKLYEDFRDAQQLDWMPKK